MPLRAQRMLSSRRSNSQANAQPLVPIPWIRVRRIFRPTTKGPSASDQARGSSIKIGIRKTEAFP